MDGGEMDDKIIAVASYPPDQPHLAYHQNPVELCT
jgi:hypothetical protein